MTDADSYNNGLIVGLSMGITAVTQCECDGGAVVLSSSHLALYVDRHIMEYKKLSQSEMMGV